MMRSVLILILSLAIALATPITIYTISNINSEENIEIYK
jgi:hypothetical protein